MGPVVGQVSNGVALKAGCLERDAGGGQQAQRVDVRNCIVSSGQRTQLAELLDAGQAAQGVFADVQRLQWAAAGQSRRGVGGACLGAKAGRGVAGSGGRTATPTEL